MRLLYLPALSEVYWLGGWGVGDELRVVRFVGLGVGIFSRGLLEYDVVGIGVYVWHVVYGRLLSSDTRP